MRVTVKLVDWVKPKWVGLIQWVEGLHRMKRLTFLWVKQSSFFLNDLKLEHQIFPAFGLKLKHWQFLGLKPAGLQTGATPLFSGFSGLWTWTGAAPWALLGLQLANSPCRSWDLSVFTILWATFFIMNLPLYINPIGSASLENCD